MQSAIVREGGRFALSVNGKTIPLYGYMTYLPRRGRYEAFAEAGVPLAFVPVCLGDRGINQETCTRPFLRGVWIGEDRYDFTPVEEAFRMASAGGAYLIPRIMTEPPAFWDKAHPEELCRSYEGEPAHASFSSEVRMRDVTKALEAFQRFCVSSGWSEKIVGWHLAGGNTEEFLRPQLHPRFFADYSEPAVRAWQAFSGSSEPPPTPFERIYRRGDEKVRRYNEFLSVSTADLVIGLCRAGKRITEGTIPIGAFYGYLAYVTDPERGHAAVSRVLASDAVDFLASPFAYTNGRALGTEWPMPGPSASAMLHGKPWFIEADIRTCLTEPMKNASPDSAPLHGHAYEGGVWAGPETEKGSISAMTKALGSILCSGCAAWWFDMWGGWYDSPAFMAFHRKARELFDAEPFEARADTAVFLEEDLVYRNPGPGYASLAHHTLLVTLARTGAAFDVFTRSDLENVDLSRYRAVFFPGETRELPEAGCAVRIGTGLGTERSSPMVDPDRRVILFSDPDPDLGELSEALSAAGVHRYGYTGDVIHAGGAFVSIHAVTSGIKRIYLPKEGTLTDAFTGEVVNVSESFGEFPMEAGESRLLRVR